jgi:hypothetical protein
MTTLRRCLLGLVLLLLSPLGAGLADAGHEPHIGFYYWLEWRREHAEHAERHEYLPLSEWSAYGWAPPAVDIGLTAGSESNPWTRAAGVRLLVRLDMKVSRPVFDRLTGRPDFSTMHRRARWRQVLAKRIVVKGFGRGSRIHLVSNFPLAQVLDQTWGGGDWPLELRAAVRVLTPKPTKKLPVTVRGVLPILPNN